MGRCLVMAYLHETAILTIIFGIIAAVLLKVILLKYEDSLIIEGVGIAMTMWLIQELNYQAEPPDGRRCSHCRVHVRVFCLPVKNR